MTEEPFFLVRIDLREIVPKSKSNPASCRAPPFGEQTGPSLALGLTIQMFLFAYITEVNLLFCSTHFDHSKNVTMPAGELLHYCLA